MKTFEENRNSAEQVESYLAGALALVDELAPPEDLRQACFVKAVDLLSSKTVQFQPDGVRVPTMAIPRG